MWNLSWAKIHTQYCSDLLRSLIYKPCMILCLDQSLWKFWIAFIICMFPAFNDVMLMFGGGVLNVKHTRCTLPHTELVPDHIPANIPDPGPQLYQDGIDFFGSQSDRWWCHVWNVFHKGHSIHQIAPLRCWFEPFLLKDSNKTWKTKIQIQSCPLPYDTLILLTVWYLPTDSSMVRQEKKVNIWHCWVCHVL